MQPGKFCHALKLFCFSENTKNYQLNKPIFDPSSPKHDLPFSSSIFSCRRYRSLPDLTLFNERECYDDVKRNDKPQQNQPDLNVQQSDKPIMRSKSMIISKEIESSKKLPLDQQSKHKYSESSDDEKKQKPEKATSPRMIYDDIADGAVSDSEVTRKSFDNVKFYE